MQQILSLHAKEGMTLAKPVIQGDGRILCGEGTVLTANLIDRLLKMDISNITVEGHPVTVEGEKSLKEELLAMQERFSNVKNIPPLMYIKNRLMKKLAASRGK